MSPRLRRDFLIIALCLVAVLSASLIAARQPSDTESAPQAQKQVGPPSPEVAARLAASHGFSILISYTDTGFEPANVIVQQGETVRFTNNSSRILHVLSTPPYYPKESGCSAISFDSCTDIASGDFWEFTFDRQGEWHYQNGTAPNDAGTITVN